MSDLYLCYNIKEKEQISQGVAAAGLDAAIMTFHGAAVGLLARNGIPCLDPISAVDTLSERQAEVKVKGRFDTVIVPKGTMGRYLVTAQLMGKEVRWKCC